MTDTQATYQPTEPPHLPITIDAFIAIDAPAEVVHGELILMSPPQLKHVRVARRLYDSLNPFVVAHNLGEAYTEAPYVLDADDRTRWVQDARMPDVSFLSADRLEAHLAKYGESGPFRLAPDLAIEIVSPHDNIKEVISKVRQYIYYGVRLVVVLDPEERTAFVYTPDNPEPKQLTETDTLTAEPVIPGWSIALADVFGSKA